MMLELEMYKTIVVSPSIFGRRPVVKAKSKAKDKALVEYAAALISDIRDVFSTNLIFETTKSADTLNFGLAGLCWSVHESALSVIQPEVIITCENDQEKSAFSFIADLYCGKIEQKFLSGTFTIKYSKIIIQSRTTLLIGLPHLSRFEIRDNEDFKRKLLNILEENNE